MTTIHSQTTAPTAPTVVLLGQTPPPREGQAIMVEMLARGLPERIATIHIRTAYSATVGEAGSFSWRKVRHLFELIRRTRAVLRAHPGAVLYYPPAPPKPMTVLRDVAFLSLTRRHAGATVFHFHAAGLSGYLHRFGILGRWLRRAYRNPEAVLAPGRRAVPDGEWIGAKRVALIPNGRAVNVVPRERAPGRFRILFAGIHRREKGIFDALETLALLRKQGVDAELVTAGDWFSEAEHRAADALVLREGLTDCVAWRGILDESELGREYADADVLFFPTSHPWETQGLVAVEAMAFGLPVVATDWMGPREVVIEGETGFLRPVHDTAGFADVLARLAKDADLRQRLGAAGRRRYEAEYQPGRFLDRVAAVLHESVNCE